MRGKNKILITGAAGFIGSFASKHYLNLGYEVLGIDSLNDYYDTDLKSYRLKELIKYRSFKFIHMNMTEFQKLKELFSSFNPDIVLHLAAQAGVRYSLINPQSYLDSNILSFFNLLECLKVSPAKKFVFASSSSVYGNSKNLPYTESNATDSPVSLYAATKKSNEALGHSFAFNNNIPTVGLRFFTVYGPKGRPDMAYFKFTDLINSKKKLTVYNKGEMSRDMTYIDDVIQGISKAVIFDDFQTDTPFEIFNLGNNSPVSTWKLIKHIENYLNIEANYSFEDSFVEVKETWANINKSKKLLEFEPTTNFSKGMDNFLDWFKSYKNK